MRRVVFILVSGGILSAVTWESMARKLLLDSWEFEVITCGIREQLLLFQNKWSASNILSGSLKSGHTDSLPGDITYSTVLTDLIHGNTISGKINSITFNCSLFWKYYLKLILSYKKQVNWNIVVVYIVLSKRSSRQPLHKSPDLWCCIKFESCYIHKKKPATVAKIFCWTISRKDIEKLIV